MFKKYNRSNQQLVAHCFFSKGEVSYDNYDKFYLKQEEEQHVIDMIEADADY